jgi:hypothetical protein
VVTVRWTEVLLCVMVTGVYRVVTVRWTEVLLCGSIGHLHLCGLFGDAVCFSPFLCTVDGRVIGDLVIWEGFSTRRSWHSRGPATEIYCRG